MMLLPFSACDGILEGIYDSPAASDSNELGFIRTDPSTIRVLFILMLLIIDVGLYRFPYTKSRFCKCDGF